MEAWDCLNNERVLLCISGDIFASDNPMQAEECDQAGLTCNLFCRTCKAGGTKEYKYSDEGYRTLFKVCYFIVLECTFGLTMYCQPGIPRNPEDTKKAINEQLERAAKPHAKEALKNLITETGLKDTFAASALNKLVESGLSHQERIKREQPRLSAAARDAIVTELLQAELKDMRDKGELLNPLLSMDGKCPYIWLLSHSNNILTI